MQQLPDKKTLRTLHEKKFDLALVDLANAVVDFSHAGLVTLKARHQIVNERELVRRALASVWGISTVVRIRDAEIQHCKHG